jgi:hypothetical protein
MREPLENGGKGTYDLQRIFKEIHQIVFGTKLQNRTTVNSVDVQVVALAISRCMLAVLPITPTKDLGMGKGR